MSKVGVAKAKKFLVFFKTRFEVTNGGSPNPGRPMSDDEKDEAIVALFTLVMEQEKRLDSLQEAIHYHGHQGSSLL